MRIVVFKLHQIEFFESNCFHCFFFVFSIELIFIFSTFCICATWYLHNWNSLYPIPPNRSEMCENLQSVFCHVVVTFCFHSALGSIEKVEQMQSKLKNSKIWTLTNWIVCWIFFRDLLSGIWGCEIWDCFEILNSWIERIWVRNCFENDIFDKI